MTAEDMDDPNTPGPDPGFDFGTGFGMVKVKDAVDFLLMALPVELIRFDAKTIDKAAVLLEWETTAEVNNAQFIVHHAYESDRFEPVAHIAGQGNSHSASTYQSVVKGLAAGWHYFQLWQEDFDGQQEELGTQAVFIPHHQNTHYSYAEGNDQVVVWNQGNEGTFILTVYTTAGQLLLQQVQTINKAGQLQFRLPAGQWSPGMYFYTIQNRSSGSQDLVSGRFVARNK